MIPQITTLPTEVNELAAKVSANKQAEVQTVLQQIFTGTADWEKQVDAIDVKGVDDKMSIQLAEVARKNAKQARLNAEKIFDAKREDVQRLKAEFDLEDKLWLKAKQVMQLKFKSIEDKAEWKANFVKRFEAEQKELRTQKRINEISKYGQINRVEFENMADESFESFLSGLKSTFEAKIEAERIAEEQRAEVERLEKLRWERADLIKPYYDFFKEDVKLSELTNEQFLDLFKNLKTTKAEHEKNQEKVRLENERLKAEAKKREEEIEAERKKHREESERLAKIEAEKIAKLKAEAEAKLKAEREAKEKLELELKAKKEAEIKLENERKEAELIAKKQAEEAAKAPIKKQLSAWVDGFSIAEINVENEKKELIKAKFEAFKRWAKSEIENI